MPVDLSKDRNLAQPFAAAKETIEKHRLTGWRIPTYLVIDFSGSMRTFFSQGHVQTLAERVLALAAHFDDDGTVPTWFFDTSARHPVPVSVNDYTGVIDRIRRTSGSMGGTNYGPVIQAVRQYHAQHAPGQPGLVIFQTDGAPYPSNYRRESERELCAAAVDPLFWQFIGFGNEADVLPGEPARFDFLRKLDTLAVPSMRVVDNAGFFPAGADPSAVPDNVLYDNLMAEFPTWMAAYNQYANTVRR
jgi:hypothetical protein